MKDHQVAHLRLDAETHEYLRRRAFNERVSIAELIRRAVDTTYGGEPGYPAKGDS